jgi:hypothetical protein
MAAQNDGIYLTNDAYQNSAKAFDPKRLEGFATGTIARASLPIRESCNMLHGLLIDILRIGVVRSIASPVQHKPKTFIRIVKESASER